MSTAPRIDELRQKFEENPRRYFAPLANELRKAGELEQAIGLCREHLPKQPGHMSGHIVLGQALFENGAFPEARGVFEQALALDPENLIALRHLGDIARQEGDVAAARRWYERVLEADPRNDDIAAHLATMASSPTPTVPIPAAPIMPPTFESALEGPEPSAVSHEAVTPAPESPDELPAGTLPGTDAADWLQAASPVTAAEAVAPLPPLSGLQSSVDLSLLGVHGRMFADLDDLEASAGETPSVDPSDVQARVDDPADDEARTDPFFGRLADDALSTGLATSEAEAAFEEGFLAEEWPDTTILMQRGATPPVAIPSLLTGEAAEAFGREPRDTPPSTNLAPEAPPVRPLEAEPEADQAPEVVYGLGWDPQAAVDDSADTAEQSGSALSRGLEGIQVGSSVYEFDDPDTIEMPPTGFVASVDEPEDAPLPAPARGWGVTRDESRADMVAPVEDVLAEQPTPESTASHDNGDLDRTAGSAVDIDEADTTFVTETMGELLVAQGFLDRAVSVFEELARRRPADQAVIARVAELRRMRAGRAADEASALVAGALMDAEPLPHGLPEADTPVRTAAAWFAALAARRVARRTPASVPAIPSTVDLSGAGGAARSESIPGGTSAFGTVPLGESLASLFGGNAGASDEAAAQGLATAFSRAQIDGGRDGLFSSGAMAAVREPTPVAQRAVPAERAAVQAEPSFDRFFPDPAALAHPAPAKTMPPTPSSTTAVEGRAAEDLAQFSAWLKELGNS